MENIVSKSAFQRFVEVRDRGRVNMLSAEARILACINEAQHKCIVKNFSELSNLYGIE